MRSLLRRLRPHRRRAPSPAPPPRRLPLAAAGDYRLADPGLLGLGPADLDPALVAAVAAGPAALRDLAEPVLPDVYALPLVTAAWCARFLAELDTLEAWAAAHRHAPARPNTMNRYGLVLADYGLDPLLLALRRDWLAPLAAALYPEVGGASLDGHHGFVVDYRPQGDLDLGLHVDDSEVTLNLCLESGGGGALFFEGRRCMAHLQDGCHPGERLEQPQRPGVALLHAGKHRHGARAIAGGRRRNLVLWASSSTWRAEERALLEAGSCPSWCGTVAGEAIR